MCVERCSCHLLAPPGQARNGSIAIHARQNIAGDRELSTSMSMPSTTPASLPRAVKEVLG